MKNGPLIFLGLFFALAISWAGLALGTQAQLGDLAPHYDELMGRSLPHQPAGIAHRGRLVYRQLGCVACHTQQVRRPGFGADKARGWGERQSVARDYVYQSRPQIGDSRLGPDLTNYGARAKASGVTEADVLNLLFTGSAHMPSYRFLFEEREVVGQRSAHGIDQEAADGFEWVATESARSLATYLLSLDQTYVLSEALPYEPEAQKEGTHE